MAEASVDHDKNVKVLLERLKMKNITLNKDKIQYKVR